MLIGLIILPLSIILFFLWFVSKKSFFLYGLKGLWVVILALTVLSIILRPFREKKVLDKEDYYGEYIIDRNFFKGEQADWQYNHFRFKITSTDSIYFYVTEGERIVETFKGTIEKSTHYSSVRIKTKMDQPNHHILQTYPTTYREIWDFYLVFKSPKYHNMYFRKGKWKSI